MLAETVGGMILYGSLLAHRWENRPPILYTHLTELSDVLLRRTPKDIYPLRATNRKQI